MKFGNIAHWSLATLFAIHFTYFWLDYYYKQRILSINRKSLRIISQPPLLIKNILLEIKSRYTTTSIVVHMVKCRQFRGRRAMYSTTGARIWGVNWHYVCAIFNEQLRIECKTTNEILFSPSFYLLPVVSSLVVARFPFSTLLSTAFFCCCCCGPLKAIMRQVHGQEVRAGIVREYAAGSV